MNGVAGALPRRQAVRTAARLILLLAFAALPARAEVVLTPALDGHIGAWLLAGPLPPRTGPLDLASPTPTAGAPVGERLGWLRWSLTDGGDGALDLGHAAPKDRRYALAAVVSLKAPLDGLLLVSADGKVTAGFDGVALWERTAPHLRGDSWDPVPVSLPAGEHVLTVVVERLGGPFSVEARLLDRTSLEPPAGATIRLPGTTDANLTTIENHLIRADAKAGLVARGYQPRLHVEFPRGAPVDPALRVTVATFLRGAATRGAGADFALPLGSYPAPFDVLLPAVTASTGSAAPFDEVRVALGGTVTASKVTLLPEVPAVVARALELRDSVLAGSRPSLVDRDVLAATLESSVTELSKLADRADAALPAAAKRLGALVDRVLAGKDPLLDPGVLALGRRSSLDGEIDTLRLHVPRSFSPGAARRYPLVVLLHGYQGSPASVMNAFLGTESFAPQPSIDGFVLAPNAHGDAFYRGPGETAVLEAIDWVMRTYPIDPDRVSVTGISMGGTGASHFAFRYPDRFSNVAALAGYHSYFVRRDVAGKALRAWEWAELTRYSPASFAENGRDLFLFVTQGTHDLPLEHSTSLADRYKMLGYRLKEDYPEIGHDVWRIAWENGKLFPGLAARKRVTDPAHVVFRTDSLRLASRAWLRVTGFEQWGVPARIDANVVARDRIVVKTSGVESFELSPPPSRTKVDGPVNVVIDGQPLVTNPSTHLAVRRGASGWISALPEHTARAKVAGVEGPIRDAFLGPLAFVYGTLDPTQTRAAREVAEHFKARWSGSARFPVLADSQVTDELRRMHSLLLVGSKDANAVVRQLDAALPLGIDGNAVRIGAARLTGDAQLGFACIFPDPAADARYVVVVEAVRAEGLFRALSLPNMLPDFIVFDSALAPAAGQQVLGEARVLGAGYFDSAWSLPADYSDRIAVPSGRDGAWWTPSPRRRSSAASATAPTP